MSAQKPREIAFHILLQHEQGRQFVEKLLEEKLVTGGLSTVDKALLQQLVYGAVRWKKTLEFLIDRKTPKKQQKAALRIILSLGLYQLFWLDRVPDHAAVNESVELVKRAGFGPQAGFVNAVLRTYVREMNETESLLTNLARDNPPLGLSHPEWLFHRWEERYGRENATTILRWNNASPPTFARVNTLKTDVEQLKAAWDKEQVEYISKSWDWAPPGLVFQLTSHPVLSQLPSFSQGLFYVQDPSTLLAVRALGALPGDKVLDFCAAPGGKTTFIAQEMQNCGLIVANDSEPVRLSLLLENCRRLGASMVQPALTGAQTMEANAPFDRILVDAPCSNTGVMRRRLDLRWRIQLDEIQRLRRSQIQILHQAAPLLKKGGRLIYSTCSLEREENEQLVGEFLSTHKDFIQVNQRAVLPFRDEVDGAFVSRLDRLT